MHFNFDQLITVVFTLFAVIDVIGSVPLFITYKQKMGGLDEKRIVLYSAVIMLSFLFIGQFLLNMFGLTIQSFAVAGAIVLFLLGLEMVLGHEIFKGDGGNNKASIKAGAIVPIAFPIIAGTASLTTIMSLKANYDRIYIILGIVINLALVYLVLKSLGWIQRVLGHGGMIAIRKFFGVVLLAMAVKIFSTNLAAFGK
ncbi:MAG: MarC family protein [Chitinophagaceae bacterium]